MRTCSQLTHRTCSHSVTSEYMVSRLCSVPFASQITRINRKTERSWSDSRPHALLKNHIKQHGSSNIVAWSLPARAATITAQPLSNLRQFGFATNFSEVYEFEDLLGKGSFGVVHICRHKQTGERFAVKTIPKKVFGGYLERHFVKRIQHEVDMYQHMGQSLNVVHLYGAFEDESCVDLVMQLCTGGELWSRIKRGSYSEAQAANIVRDVLRAIAQCHSRGVIVRDIKPENYLFLNEREDAPLKLIDFGIADWCGENQQLEDRAGSPIYCAPEVLRRKYGQKADVWSAGIIAYELLAARLPFQSEDGDMLSPDLKLSHVNFTNKEIFNAILYSPMDFEVEPWPRISEQAKDFVKKLLIRDPADRPSAAEALAHPWLKLADTAAVTTSSPTASGAAEASSGPALQLVRTLDDSFVQRLQRYGTYARLKQVALSKVADCLSYYDAPALEQLRQALGSVSIPGDDPGTASFKIPYLKMVELLKSGQFDLSHVEVVQLLSSFHIDDQGNMDASEWLAALLDWQDIQDAPDWQLLVDRVFDTIDSNQTGQIDIEELEDLLCGDDGCPFEDTIPSVIREIRGDISASSSGDDGDDVILLPPEIIPSLNATIISDSATSSSSSSSSSRDGMNSVERELSKKGGSVIIDRSLFTRLLRMTKQDRLDLFESRRRQSNASSGDGSD